MYFFYLVVSSSFFFFFNDTATTEIYTLSLHDALPICFLQFLPCSVPWAGARRSWLRRSEEHTSELQSRQYLVCRLLLEKKKHERDRGAAEEPGAAGDQAQRQAVPDDNDVQEVRGRVPT